jgi:integrase
MVTLVVTRTRQELRKYPGVFRNEARGRWEQRITLDGKRMLVSAKTAPEVAAKVTTARARHAKGLAPADGNLTVKKYIDWWLAEILPSTVSASTTRNYRDVLTFYVLPHIGAKQLSALKPGDVTVMLNNLERAGAAPNTRRAARSVLRRALRRAEQEGIVSRNVAAVADGVRVPVNEGRTLTPDQARAFLEAVSTDRLSAAFAVMLALGLRRGETLGLTWDDVDLVGKFTTLTVNRSLKRLDTGLSLDQPKTRLSRRTLYLPAPLAVELRAHRKRQATEQLHAGREWVALPLGVDLVFRTPFGTAIDPDNFKNRTYKLTEAAGVGRWGPHELRHSSASILLAMGVPLKTVSETLGHSSIRITADVYGHLLEPARKDAAEAAGRALWGAS